MRDTALAFVAALITAAPAVLIYLHIIGFIE